MVNDFSAKKRRPTGDRGGGSSVDERRRQVLQVQQKTIQALTEQLLKLEFIKNVKNPTSLSELWQENLAKIEQFNRPPPTQMSPKPSSRQNIILGSEMFEDFELKTSIDGSARKHPLRTIKSQSPGKEGRLGLPLHYPPSNFESLDEAQSFQFGNNSEFTEKQFSNKKQSPALGRVIQLQP